MATTPSRAERTSNLHSNESPALTGTCEWSRSLFSEMCLPCDQDGSMRAFAPSFFEQEFRLTVNVEGGTLAWDQAGLPVTRGKKMMSLERQVRIAAGSLVLIGVVLAWMVHPYLIRLSAFVGAGLVFAGITDTCGMGMLLARMPWNQVAWCRLCDTGAA